MKFISSILTLCIFVVTSQVALAQSPSSFRVKTLVTTGKNSKEIDSILNFGDKTFSITSSKAGR